jgi:hypothetical protein
MISRTETGWAAISNLSELFQFFWSLVSVPKTDKQAL